MGSIEGINEVLLFSGIGRDSKSLSYAVMRKEERVSLCSGDNK